VEGDLLDARDLAKLAFQGCGNVAGRITEGRRPGRVANTRIIGKSTLGTAAKGKN